MFQSPAISLDPTGQNSDVSFTFMFQSPAISLDLTGQNCSVLFDFFFFQRSAISLGPTGHTSSVSFAFMFQSPAISLGTTGQTLMYYSVLCSWDLVYHWDQTFRSLVYMYRWNYYGTSLISTVAESYDWAAAWDFQQFDILTSVDLDEPLQSPFKLRNSKWCSVSSFTIINTQATSKGSDQTARKLICGFAGRTYHIVGNLMHWLSVRDLVYHWVQSFRALVYMYRCTTSRLTKEIENYNPWYNPYLSIDNPFICCNTVMWVVYKVAQFYLPTSVAYLIYTKYCLHLIAFGVIHIMLFTSSMPCKGQLLWVGWRA